MFCKYKVETTRFILIQFLNSLLSLPTTPSIFVGSGILSLLIVFTSLQKSSTLLLLNFLASESASMAFSLFLIKRNAYYLALYLFFSSNVGPCLAAPESVYSRKASLATLCNSATWSFHPGTPYVHYLIPF